MKSETPLDYAVFQLSPKRSRCELFVSSDGNTEKLASGLVKPFVTHLKVAEEQVASAVQSIKLEIERRKNAETWFTKGTLERFVRFVSTPEVLELVNTFDAEMSQLEAARRIYSQGARDQPSSTLGGSGTGTTAVADATKKELLRAIDVRLVAVRQDLTTACARAAAAGFNPDTVSELQMFADRFGAHRLNEACSKFTSLCERRTDLINSWKAGVDDRAVRSSYGSDMSIDEDPATEEQHPSGSHPHKHPTGREPDATQQQLHLEQSKPSTCQQQLNSSSSTFPLRRSRESSIEKDIGRESDEAFEKVKKEESGTQTGPPARRLSVQDRINLFETKQKEVSGSGGKPIAVAKSVELRRLSSDVSSAPAVVEKAVLRRWSGVSDMSISIDLTGEKKETDSPLYTPSVDRKGLNDTAATAKPEFRSVPARVDDCGFKDQSDSQTPVGVISGEEFDTTQAGANSGTELTVSSGRSIEASVSNKSTSTVETDEIRHKTRSSSSFTCTEDNNLKNQATSQTQSRFLSGGNTEQFGLTAHAKLKDSDEFAGIENKVASEMQIAGLREKAAPPALFGAFASRVGDIRSADESYKSHQHPRVENLEQGEDVGFRDQSVPQSRFRTPSRTAVDSGQLEGGSGSKIREAFAAQFKGTEGDLLASQPRWKSLGEVEEVGKKGFASSERQSDSSTKVEHSGFQRMKFQKEVSCPEQVKKAQGRRDENSSVYGNNKTSFSGKMVSEDQEGFGSIPVPPVEHVRRVRQSKGNQELNDELTRKANDLEKSFAEHKLRFPGDQSNSKRRSKPTDTQIEQAASLPYRKQVEDIASPQFPDKNRVIASSGSSSNMVKLDASSVIDPVDNQDYGEALKQNFSELGFSDDSKGKFYDKYMLKRDAKLREEWGSKGVEKEAKMKAMQDSLEQSRAEMRAKFSGSVDRQDSVFSARRRAEGLRSFNTRSVLKREQQPLDFVQSEDDEDPSEFSEQRPFGYDRSFSDASLGDGVSRSSQSKKLLPNRTLSSFTPRTSAAPIPRSVIKASNSSSGRRRMQSDNPLAQSVPNFSDLRKENTKPYSAVSKTTRSQLRNYSRSRSANEEMPQVREEKPRRSHSLRKSSASPAEFKETAPLNSEGGVVSALKFDTEQTEQSLYDKFSRNVESKPFLRKNNGIGPGAGAGIAKLKASMMSEAMNNEEESDELAFEPEDSVDVVNDEEEFETMTSEDHSNMDQGGARLSQESEKLVNSGSENGDTLQSFSQVDPSLVAELPAAVSSTFHPVGPLQDSPGGSPMSWNSRIHHPFSYTHEASDIDASADSPMGSPTSWNLHSLNQTEADAARMRKKWGSAQKPIIVANSSNIQSRKDVTKGFKRLLKFGRKSRGTESLVDWVSATTSEGDDDTEDGRDPANRSSEDLRKSRMGFSQGQPSEDSVNESDFFSEEVQVLRSSIPAPPANFKLREDQLSGSSMKAPRSFFSLSSFRSKGSDSKPR